MILDVLSISATVVVLAVSVAVIALTVHSNTGKK